MRSEAEIRAKLQWLRGKYEESRNNPTETLEDRHNEKYFEAFEKHKRQLDIEIDWIGEIAVLEWVLDEKPTWLATWMREVRA